MLRMADAPGSNEAADPAFRSTAHAGTVRRSYPWWVQRSGRDRRAATGLEIESDGVVVLCDRRMPASKTTIQLIAVSPAGVFVVDTRTYKGLAHIRRPGPISDLGPDELHVGRRNCTDTVTNVCRQVDAVRAILRTAPWGSEVPVHAMLCLTKAEWGFASAIEVGDVWVGWPRLIASRAKAPEVMDSRTVEEVSRLLADSLPIA